MKKLFVLIYACAFILCVSGCNHIQDAATTEESLTANIENTSEPDCIVETTTAETTTIEKTTAETTTVYIPDEERGILRSNEKRGEGSAERFGVSKTLTFVCWEYHLWSCDEDVITRFNELLVNKYGCDFVVEFIGADIITDKKSGYTYYDYVSDVKRLEQPVDILLTAAPAKYSLLVEEGYFISWKEYLETTELGQKMYDSYPEVMWKMVERDGEIYGYSPVKTPARRYALACNRKLAEELGLNVQEGFSFYDIADILLKIEKSDQNNIMKDIAPIYYATDTWINMLGYCDMGYGIYAKKNEEGKLQALCPSSDEEFVKLCKTIRKYNEKGWLVRADYATKETRDAVANGKFLFYNSVINQGDMVKNNIKISGESIWGIYEVIVGNVYYVYYPLQENIVYGVTTWSEYKEEAMKLISLIQTEAELSNLLAHGIEGDHYAYVDREVVKLPSDYSMFGFGDRAIENPNITFPEYLEPDDKLGYYKELAEKYEYNPAYSMDRKPYVEQLKVLYAIYKEYETGLLTGTYEDVDATIAELDKRLKEAGIEQIIDEFNRQLQELEERGI